MSTAHARSAEIHAASEKPCLRVTLLGPLRVHRGDVALELPASRKVRALIGYLALAPEAQQRSHLCDLFWDIAHDPRRELRWCLNKIRNLLDDSKRSRVQSRGDTVTLDLSDCFVDAIHIADTIRSGIETLDLEQLRVLVQQLDGDLLGELKISRSPRLNSWLSGQRRRFRLYHVAILKEMVRHLPDHSEELIGPLKTWLELDPFALQAHERLLTALAEHGRMDDGEAHLAATATTFKNEGLDWAPLAIRWRAVCARRANELRPQPRLPLQLPRSEDHLASIGPNGGCPSIAVMPFGDDLAAESGLGEIADSLTHDVITRLARLRSVVVIARSTVFALTARNITAGQVSRHLKVDYICSGWVRRLGAQASVTIELAHARTTQITWAKGFEFKPDDSFAAVGVIGEAIVASVIREVGCLKLDASGAPPNGGWRS